MAMASLPLIPSIGIRYSDNPGNQTYYLAMTFMPDTDQFLNQNFIYLIAGIVFLFDAIISTCIGRTFSGRGGWARRSTNPGDFWCSMAVLYVSSIFFIGKYLGAIYRESIFHPTLWFR